MVFAERDMQLSNLDEATAILEHASYLTDAESRYYPEMVPIRENSRLGCNIIRVEDFIDYGLSNGITEGGYALAQICEASGIEQSSVAFSVDEVSILEDTEMDDTVRALLNTGVKVYASPINEHDMAYVMTESVIEAMIASAEQGNEEYGDALFEAFISDDFDTYLAEQFIQESIQDKIHSAGNSVQSYMNKVQDTVRQAAGKSRNWIARKISSLRSLAIKAKNSLGDNASALVNKINQGINYLGAQLKRPFTSK